MTEEKKEKTWLQKLKEKVETWQAIFIALASIGALIMAFWSNVKADSNLEAIEKTDQEVTHLKDLYSLSENIAKEFSIDNIVQTSGLNMYCLSGRYEGSTSDFQGKKLFVLINQGNLFWNMTGDIIIESDGDWFHNNISLGMSDGEYKLLVVICNLSEVHLLDQLKVAEVFTGKPSIIQVINSETIVKSGDSVKIQK